MTEENEPVTESNGCIPKFVTTWRSFVATLNNGHQITPLNPIAPKDCEFIVINSKIRIRVIHINPLNLRKSFVREPLVNSEIFSSKRSSLSEEYWFTKWNKPLKNGICNCSFRRSMRYSIISNQPTSINKIDSKRESKSSFDLPPTKITNVESFVERLIQDTFYEAFQEYYISKCKKKTGKINLAYENTEEEDCGVVLRRKFQTYQVKDNNLCNIAEKIEANNSKVQRNSLSGTKLHQCVHKKVDKKPFVLLFHGIGTSADIWWIVMNSLVNKGFEVAAPDMLGHGFSSAPNKASLYSFENLLLQAITIFDHFIGTDDKRKCVLIGHSYGCSIVTAMYQHRAPQIAQIILISGGGPTPLSPPADDNEITPFGCAYTMLRPLLFCGLKRSFFYSSRGKHFNVFEVESGIPNHILQYLSHGQNWPEGDAAFHRRILIPTLLVHGLQDKQVTLVQECEMERTIPRAFLELIPNSGHLSMVETPEHLTHMILCFLDWWS